MKDKFLIKDLNPIDFPLDAQSSYTIVENEGTTYRVAVDDLYKDIIVNRLSVGVSRQGQFGPNVLSITYCDEWGDPITTTSVQLQDGMLSTAKYNNNTHILSLYFNNTSPSPSPITVDLAELKDIYTAGNGLGLNGNQFYVSANYALKSDLNSYLPLSCRNNLSNGINASNSISVTTGKAVYDYVQPNINNINGSITNINNNITTINGKFDNYIPLSCRNNLSSGINTSNSISVTTGKAVYDYIQPTITTVNNMSNLIYVNNDGTLCSIIYELTLNSYKSIYKYINLLHPDDGTNIILSNNITYIYELNPSWIIISPVVFKISSSITDYPINAVVVIKPSGYNYPVKFDWNSSSTAVLYRKEISSNKLIKMSSNNNRFFNDNTAGFDSDDIGILVFKSFMPNNYIVNEYYYIH